MVAQMTLNHEVEGSTPSMPTIVFFLILFPSLGTVTMEGHMELIKTIKEMPLKWVAILLVLAWTFIWGSWGIFVAPMEVLSEGYSLRDENHPLSRLHDFENMRDELGLLQTAKGKNEPLPVKPVGPITETKETPPPGFEKIDWFLGQWPTIASILIMLPFILTRWRNFFKGKDVNMTAEK